MLEKIMENNQVSLIGKIVSDFTFSHEMFDEGFYLVDLEVNRLSGHVDVIPLMISERLVDVTENYQGCTVEAIGAFCICSGDPFYGGIYRLYKDESDLSGGLYLQDANLSGNSTWKRDCGYPAGGKPSIWQIRLHTMYRLGQKCQICV